MADDFDAFRDAKAKAFDLVNALRPLLAAADKAIHEAEQYGRAAEIKVSRIHASLPSLSHKITFPEGLEPPAPVEATTALTSGEIEIVRRALELAKTDPEAFDVEHLNGVIRLFDETRTVLVEGPF